MGGRERYRGSESRVDVRIEEVRKKRACKRTRMAAGSSRKDVEIQLVREGLLVNKEGVEQNHA